jgi:hypothetical protein
VELQEYLPTPPVTAFLVPGDLDSPIASLADVEDFAVKVRSRRDLGLDPIPVLTDMLEARASWAFRASSRRPRNSTV